MGRTTRRNVLAGLTATLAPALLAAQAQPRRIGAIVGTPADDPDGQARAAAFVQGLGALNWREGSNLLIDWRWPGSDAALIEHDTAALVALGSEVLFVSGNAAVMPLQRQTSTTPIVFVNVIDPVGAGFVASLARPGGNITGFTNYDPPMATKWLGMLTQISPPAAHVAVLYSPAFGARLMLRAIEEGARSLAVTVRLAPCHDDAEIEATMTDLVRGERGGLLVLPDALTTSHRDFIVALAARQRLPSVYPSRPFAASGGLMSYGVDSVDSYRRAAVYVDRILKGAKPADLPVQNPTKFELVINLKTAKALGVTVAPSLLATADEVIE